jgi:hypothetical protein
VDTAIQGAASSLNRRFEVVKRDMESKQEAHAKWVETRMQQMLCEAQISSQTAVAAMEKTARDAEVLTQMHHLEIDDRIDSMKRDLEQQVAAVAGISDDQWQKIGMLVDDKIASTKQACSCSSSSEVLSRGVIETSGACATSAPSVALQLSSSSSMATASGSLDDKSHCSQEAGDEFLAVAHKTSESMDNQASAGELVSALRLVSECIGKLHHNQEALCSRPSSRELPDKRRKQPRVMAKQQERPQKESREMSNLEKAREEASQAICSRNNERTANLKLSSKSRLSASKK